MKPRGSDNGAPSNPEDRHRRLWEATRCAWTTNGRQCRLTGTRSDDTGGVLGNDGIVKGPRCFCPYHMDRMNGDRRMDSRDFADWLEQYVTTYPPATYGENEFTRHRMEDLWAAACGNEKLPGVQRHHVEPSLLRPASEAQKAIAWKKAKAMLHGRFSPEGTGTP